MLTHIILDYEKDAEVIDNDALIQYSGSKNFAMVESLEAVADTTELTLSFLGDLFPNIEKLRLNNSKIASIRDISTRLTNLKFLSLAGCGITSLDGISVLSSQLEELYLAFNRITEVTELMSLDKITVLDLEENDIAKVEDVEILRCCPALRALTLAGNPAAESETYTPDVARLIPQLVYLDEKRLRPKTRKLGQVTIAIAETEESKEEPIITDQMAEKVNERPPSARGYHGESTYGRGLLKKDAKTPTKKICTPKVTRPVSSCRPNRIRKAELCE